MKHHKSLMLLFILGISFSMYSKSPFATMTTLKQYADSVPEYVDAENGAWLDPDFSEFHESIRPGIARKVINWIGVGYKAWTARGFKKLIQTLIKKRELAGQMGDFIQKYVPQQGDRLLIWTDLFGAFHSLVRDLSELQSKGILDNKFKIIKSNYLLVFNGNVIDHSPYVLETLTLVMRLLAVNPQKVIYVRGTHEERQEWHSYGLARELKIRAAGLTDELIPLNTIITRFFNTLPLGLFLPEITENQINLVLIANNLQSEAGFKEKRFAGFFEKEESQQLSSLKLGNKVPSTKKVKVRAIITGEDRSTSYHQTDGLSMIGTKREATAWLGFSSPTGRNRRLYEFFDDAFVELSITNGLSEWTLTLFNQDVRELFGFSELASYNLVTGLPVKKGELPIKPIAPKLRKKPKKTGAKKVAPRKKEIPPPIEKELQEPEEKPSEEYIGKKEEVTFGATMDLSKSASTLSKPFKKGLDLAFAKAVREGGVGAFIPRFVVYDDEYTPSKTPQIVSNFMNDLGVDIFVGSLGSTTNATYIPLVKEKKILSLFPYTGAPIFRVPELDYFVHNRVGYVDEGRALADYAIDKLKAKKIVIFYQNDAFGKGALQGAMEELNKRGFKNVIKVPYERNDVQFDQQAKIIKEEDPDTIFFFAITPSASSLIRQLGVQFFRGKNLIGMSVYDESFDRFLEDKGLRFLMVRMVPNPKTSDLEIVQEYRQEAKRINHTPNLVSLEGYINASILFDILKRIKPPLTKDKIVSEFKKIKNYNFKGIELDYNPQTHELGKALWLDTGEGPWIEKQIRAKETQKEMPEVKEA